MCRLGLDGLELLRVHFESTEPVELYALKQHAFRHGVALVAVSAHYNFVTPDAAIPPLRPMKAIGLIAQASAMLRSPLLAFLNAGGYGASMSSNHCMRGELTEYLLL